MASSARASKRLSFGQRTARPSVARDLGATDAAMAIDFLGSLSPPLLPESLAALKNKLPQHAGISVSVLAQLGLDGLKEVTGIESCVERARILSAVSDPTSAFAPPPLGPNGEPVIVRPKIGFTQVSQLDTVHQTVNVRFFLDLYWRDPRVVGLAFVPDGIWRPAHCYVLNQHGEMTRILHTDRPVLIDSAEGLLLWPIELVGTLQNPMDLHAFPFDHDIIELHIHQNEQSSREEYLLRPYESASDEQASVRFFFGIHADLTECAHCLSNPGLALAYPPAH